MLERVTNPNYK